MTEQLEWLTPSERRALESYVELLRARLAGELESVFVYGSVARGETWPAAMRIRSDLDLLVVTSRELDEREKQELWDETYPLFLESGRQLSPVFWTSAKLDQPPDHARAFAENVRHDAVVVWPRR